VGEELAAFKAEMARLLEGKSKKAMARAKQEGDVYLMGYYEGLSDGFDKARNLILGIGPWRKI